MRLLPALALAAALAGLSPPARAQETLRTEHGAVRVATYASGLVNPWGLAFLPDGRLLVTEKPGRLRIVAGEGRVSAPVAGVPEVMASGQGGLLDVAIDPEFERTGAIYLAYAEGTMSAAGTAVARARLDGEALGDVRVIFRQTPKVDGGNHFGARLVFAPDDTLFVTLGERFKFEPAQDLNSHLGKIVRIARNGAVPRDNPFVDRAGARPEIWSYGHRNVQGAALHPATRKLWVAEHGARGGDEINIVEEGKNYGWPVIAYGVHYDGRKIGEGTSKPGMEQPIYYWDPAIAPSGLAFYTGDLFPRWKGNAFVGGLLARALVRLELDGARVAKEERLQFQDRIRAVAQGPDGALYLLTDSPQGRVLRLAPAG